MTSTRWRRDCSDALCSSGAAIRRSRGRCSAGISSRSARRSTVRRRSRLCGPSGPTMSISSSRSGMQDQTPDCRTPRWPRSRGSGGRQAGGPRGRSGSRSHRASFRARARRPAARRGRPPGSAAAAAHHHQRADRLGAGVVSPDQHAAALARWPSLREDFADPAAYNGRLEDHLRQLHRETGRRPSIAPLDVDDLAAWAARNGHDPDTGSSRSRFAAELARAGHSLAWPPGRNDACWCRSRAQVQVLLREGLNGRSRSRGSGQDGRCSRQISERADVWLRSGRSCGRQARHTVSPSACVVSVTPSRAAVWPRRRQ